MDDNARMNAEDPSSATPSQPSIEDELRAAYEELEAARRKLEELKAKYPPSTAGNETSNTAGAADAADAAPATAAPNTQQPFGQQAANAQQAAGARQAAGAQHTAGAQQSYAQHATGTQQPYDQQAGGAQQAASAQQSYGQQPDGAHQQCSYQPYAQQPYGQQGYAQQTYAQQSYQQYQPYQQPYYGAQVVQTKDHVAAGLLAIFLGSFGVHKFYLGYNSTGFVMLAVSIVGSLLTLGIAAGVMCVIGFIEGIIYLVKSQTDFEQLYVYNKREWF